MSHLRSIPVLACLLCALAAGACDPDDEPHDDISLDIPAACNPLGGVTCLAPWPSAAFLVEADTHTGYRLDLPAAAMPVNGAGVAVDTWAYNRHDGFSPSGAILAMFPGGVSAEGLPSHTDPAFSLASDSPTVVLNMDTGERLLHFAEVDRNALYPEEQSLIIRPLERMAPASRYAVALRRSIKDAGGAPLPVPPGFELLLRGRADEHPRLARLASRHDAVLAALEAEGIEPEELVLAWDFVTASDEFLTGDLLHMRDQALPLIEAGVPFEVRERERDPALVHRRLTGTYTAPGFLAGDAEDVALARDEHGVPAPTGSYEAPFAAILPACVADPGAELPIPVVIFGHGLFGSGAASLDDSLLQTVASEHCFAMVATDFIGLSQQDIGTVALAATDLNSASAVSDKLAQSVINFITLGHLARGGLNEDELFRIDDQPILDPGRVYYLGASLGGIMGNVVMAYDPYILRGVLGVPGGAWSLLFERSLAWGALQGVARLAYTDPHEQQILIALLSMRLEPYDPITTAPRVIEDPLPDTPPKQIFMYQGVGDSLVTNLSTEMTARTMGIPVVGPSVYVPHGMSERDEVLASGLAIYDEHPAPLPPATNVPPDRDNGTHGGVNRRPAVLRQIQHFLFTGELTSTCELDGVPAPCDCATGACD